MSSTCQCPSPPGGQVTCEDGQMALCTKDPATGAINASCRTSASGASQLEIQNWALSIVTETDRAPRQTLTLEDREILLRGQFVRADGTIVFFRIPRRNSGGFSFQEH